MLLDLFHMHPRPQPLNARTSHCRGWDRMISCSQLHLSRHVSFATCDHSYVFVQETSHSTPAMSFLMIYGNMKSNCGKVAPLGLCCTMLHIPDSSKNPAPSMSMITSTPRTFQCYFIIPTCILDHSICMQRPRMAAGVTA